MAADNPLQDPISASPALLRWRELFGRDPVEAVGGLLAGRFSLGPYSRAQPADALAQLVCAQADRAAADQALLAWLEVHIGKPAPEEVSAKRFADALVQTFRAVEQLPLPITRAWAALRHGQLRAWLRGFHFGSTLDPEAALLVALAHGQTDRNLQGLWMGLARLEGGLSLDYGLLGLLGLRQMPADDQGAVQHGLPAPLLRGVLDLGDALARRGDKKGKEWLAELDFLAMVYPQSRSAWEQRFRPVVQARELSRPVRNWLDQRYPAALHPFDRNRQRSTPLEPPSMEEREQLRRQMEDRFSQVRPQLTSYFERHRLYARESGDSFYLVRSFCNLGERLVKLELDFPWARDLAHEAARWAPQDPQTWSLLARALEAEGDWRRAEAVLWHARRRFPQDDQRHNQLAHALVMHGHREEGEAIYREAIRLFPNDAVCLSDLGHTLKLAGDLEGAALVYRQARERFSTDEVCAVALTDVLIELGNLKAAEEALDHAGRVCDHDNRKLQQVQQRFRRAQAGERLPPRRPRQPKEGPAGDLSALADITGHDLSHAPALGRATLWRRSGERLDEAAAALDGLPEGGRRIAEQGLLVAAREGWSAAARWIDGRWERFGGDGVLRVHRQRAHARAGETVDWSLEHKRYPWLLPVILTEERGEPPRFEDAPEGIELAEEQMQDRWYARLAAAGDQVLRDLAEEDFLAARHLL